MTARYDDLASTSHYTTNSLNCPIIGTIALRVRIHSALRLACAPFSKFRALMTKPRSTRPIVPCDDPVEAYVQACIASPFFTYVSPEIYSLCDTKNAALDDQASNSDDKT
jgi:hypothetical protein